MLVLDLGSDEVTHVVEGEHLGRGNLGLSTGCLPDPSEDRLVEDPLEEEAVG